MHCAMLRSPSVRMPKEKSPSSTNANPYPTLSTTSPPAKRKSPIPKPSIDRSRPLNPRPRTTPGAAASATASVANPSRNLLPMAQAEMHWPVSLSLSAKNWAESNEQSPFGSAQSSTLVSALRVALQRCSYPPHECQESIMTFYLPSARGTSLLCRIGDISTLH